MKKNKVLFLKARTGMDDPSPPMAFSFLGEIAKEEGFEVMVAKDGKEGLATALKTHPDCILLDILMPVMDGMKMLDALRKDPWGNHANVLMLTNLSSTERELASHALGVDEYLIKTDWKLEDVVVKVREKIGVNI